MFKRRRIGDRVPFSSYTERHQRLSASGKLYYVYGPQKEAVPWCRCIVCERKRKNDRSGIK